MCSTLFAAFFSQKLYFKKITWKIIIPIIKEGSGEHFDPDVVEAFVNAEEKIRAVTDKLH